MSSFTLPAGPRASSPSTRGARRPRLLRLVFSPWTLGLLLAVASWNVKFTSPFGGLDPSWAAGLYMAANRGLQFGTQVIFTYGPLGFLAQPWMWYSSLSALAFVFEGLLHVLLCVSLVWALRRTLHPLLALLAAFLVLVSCPAIDVAVALAAVWCLAALSPAAPAFTPRVVVLGGALLGAAEILIYVRSGVLVLAMAALTLLPGKRWRRELPAFVALAIGFLVLLWLAAGQSLGNLPGFVSTSAQIVSGYSQAMGLQGFSSAYRVAAIVVGVALVAVGAWTSASGRPRLAAAGLALVTVFILFKEAAVRAEVGHTEVFFATVATVVAAIAFGRRRWLAVAALAAIIAVNVHLDSLAGAPAQLNPVTYARRTSDQVQLLLDPQKRNLETVFFFQVQMIHRYGLPPAMLRLLKRRTVQADPDEVAALWAYKPGLGSGSGAPGLQRLHLRTGSPRS